MRVPPFVSRVEPSGADFCSHEGAHRLAALIRAAWQRAGHDVPVVVESIYNPPPPQGATYRVVMPTLVNGLPVR